MAAFGERQSALAAALALNRPGSSVPHVMVVLPSFSVGESLLAHYGPRISALEHRYLVAHTLLHRISSCEMVFVGSQDPGPEIVDYYVSLVPAARQADVRSRFRVFAVPDRSARSVAEKLLERPDLLAAIREHIGGRPAFLEPWNVTEHEMAVAEALGLPIHGTAPELRPLAYKSAGRRLFRRAGVPVAYGHEDVRTPQDVVSAAEDVGRNRPGCRAVVVKHDDSGAGDGNVVLPLDGDLPARVAELPEWYLADLRAGGVVEERVSGTEFTSPSAQFDLLPDGTVRLLSTHEQELGGEGDQAGQVYVGCRFPAHQDYAGELGRQALAVGELLGAEGVVGRVGLDFAAARDRGGEWRIHALEINMRKGGTTHPYAALRNLVPGAYDGEKGQWVTEDGGCRAYRSTDNLVSASWTGLPPETVIKATAASGLQFDPATGTGVVLHMLSCLAVDGRFGLTAIGHDPAHADELFSATRDAVADIA